MASCFSFSVGGITSDQGIKASEQTGQESQLLYKTYKTIVFKLGVSGGSDKEDNCGANKQ